MPVPSYHSRVYGGLDTIDEVAVDCAGLSNARAQAMVAAGEMLHDKGRDLGDGSPRPMAVTAVEGRTLCELHVASS